MVLRFSKLVSSRTKDVYRRVERAIKEFSENLQREVHQTPQLPSRTPKPAYARVPAQNNGGRPKVFVRDFSTYSPPHWRYSFRLTPHRPIVHPLKRSSQVLRTLNHGFVFKNFSETYQNSFRLKMYHQGLRMTYKLFFSNLRAFHKSSASYKIAKPMARAEAVDSNNDSVSSHLDFPVNFSIGVHNKTYLTGDVLDDIFFSIAAFQNKLNEVKSNLKKVFELGELPIQYLAEAKVLRVYFPNCDKERLENLCREKEVTAGVIVEKATSAEASRQAPMSPTFEDISSGSFDFSCSSDDILSSSSSELDIHLTDSVVRPVQVAVDGNVSINEEYHWVSI
ncbi:uncharacterized protein LODBEIA_P48190 [Lodderomyces beijingensis]|uniref:Uncharacterized protein n=1 Tax=Lodderomyces beijingensis TaxID=1775926 RepID=A0ABP0ZTR0_9ASCO